MDNPIKAVIEGIKANGIEPPRTDDDFRADAQRIIDALDRSGFKIVQNRITERKGPICRSIIETMG